MVTGSVLAARFPALTAIAMRAPVAHRLLTLAGLASLLVAAASTSWAASGCSARIADQIFEVNVRPAGCTTSAEKLAECIKVREFAVHDEFGGRKWIDSDLSRATSPTSPDMVTLVYIHGNKVDSCMARDRGLRVYRSLVRRACDERPIRFILFSWPATEVKGLLRDFRVKAARTRPVGWQLAWVLNQFPSDTQISVLGYSYGARIVGGAMHLLAGGNLSGLRLADPIAHPPMQVAFFAAATHASWFGPNCYHGRAMQQIDHLLLLNNRLDPAMRYYKWIDKHCNPQAMGLCGPLCLDAEARSRIECYDCSKCVGRSHDLFKYTATGRTMTEVWEHLTYSD